MRRLTVVVLGLLASSASAQVSTRPPGDIPAPREVDCSEDTTSVGPICSVTPAVGYDRTGSFTEWGSQYSEGLTATLLTLDTRAAGLAFPLGGLDLKLLDITAPMGATQESTVYGERIRVTERGTGTTTTGESNLTGIYVTATSYSPTIKTNAWGISSVLSTVGENHQIGTYAAVEGIAQFGDNTTVVSNYVASVLANGAFTLSNVGTDINKVYKFYAPPNTYGRNYFGQPADAGLYAAEVVGGKGLYTPNGVYGAASKTIADAVATAFARLSVSDDDYEGCGLLYTAYAEDTATDARQTRTGRNHVAILNNSGTETAVFSTGDSSVAVTAGTFTCAFTSASTVADTIDLRAACDTSLAATTTLTFEWRLDCPSGLTVTPQ